jgi:hypothetical protein
MDRLAQLANDRTRISELIERVMLFGPRQTETEGDSEFRLRERQTEID